VRDFRVSIFDFRFAVGVTVLVLAGWIGVGCSSKNKAPSQRLGKVGQKLERRGDEIMVCGQLFHTGAPVVLWTDPKGYDAYRTERRFAPMTQASYSATTRQVKAIDSPNRYGLRQSVLTTQQAEQVRGGGWPLELLQEKVDQFVIHYDVCGTAAQCFYILHDYRNLSVHFMLDIDGTIYQTLDLKERAWHASSANSRSVGIEIANIGAYRPDARENPLDQWYQKDSSGKRRIALPAYIRKGYLDPKFVGRPIRDEAVVGEVQGRQLRMYDLTPQQYDSLTKLTATLCRVFPNMKCDYPRDEAGKLITKKLSREQLDSYQGVLGHYHVDLGKTDPGPAFQWDLVIDGARKMMK
jgi:N-acetyl-anhydromuramyl-L-alanine amidase AmpD